MDAARTYHQLSRLNAKAETSQQSGGGHLDRETRLKLGLALRTVYQDFANLDLPKRLTDLLKQLDGQI